MVGFEPTTVRLRTTRHTLLSEALESGLTIPQVAAIAGHKDGRMILQHYGRVINQVQLPD